MTIVVFALVCLVLGLISGGVGILVERAVSKSKYAAIADTISLIAIATTSVVLVAVLALIVHIFG